MMQIVDVELKMPLADFETEFQNCIDNWPATMNYSIKAVSTRMGRNMYKLEVDNGNSATMEVVAEKDDVTGDVYFHPIKLSNMAESFYKFSYTDDIAGQDEDPTMLICHAFKSICENNKGTVAGIDSAGRVFLVKEGSIQNKISLAIVDSNGDVYSNRKAKSISGEDENDVDFHVKTPINEWLQDHKDIGNAIAKLPLSKKMDYIGKWLIQARVNDEMSASEFADIFCQAGLFGFSDPSVLNIYKLLM